MAEKFDVVDIIRTKRDGGELSTDEIRWVIDAYTRGVVGDEQMAALNMAIFIRDMDRREIVDWTQAMIDSGETMNFDSLSKPTTDKHSTGGVGDKVTLPLGPLVSSYGVAVPQLSGRGLGHTGGTLDKLEAIPGWKADVPNDLMMKILEDSGAVVAAAGAGLAPADKKIYALRDITATVDCIPLIASSIMSKKIAEGTSSLVLDVKVGTGAFMKEFDKARQLAETMVQLGRDAGVDTRALLTDMNVPLGRKIGNGLEVEESIEVLQGGGPADLVEITCELARHMLEMAGVHDADVEEALKDGRAMDSWRKMIKAQGGDPDAKLARAPHTHEVFADRDGFVSELDALALGVGSWRLGAGRARKEDPVQLTAGIEIHAGLGEKVTKGQKLLTLHTETPDRFERALESINTGLKIGDEKPAERKIILDKIV
ncbi:pyrimidine-nucleoside phosphorylase [Corynebacterium phocae]|uniref:Pyrimidine-nucleoside phosphorylase n=1 Tax=Corynebacterium phocae TaxID=161895 RepID=A0A1L7D2G5_9CORY|nr:thymidine phosphorylase [Corynebacterium phocae]APT92171.1 pyrimidine-nucleoside phosphorylase [Corynebacterium phocae]KAA8725958.1 thymidine phosphorylase [Corynebacterium phocae]